MNIFSLLKADWLKVLLLCIAIVIFFFAFISMDWKNLSFKANWIQYLLIVIITYFLFDSSYFFLKNTDDIEYKKLLFDFLKMLFPTALAILSLLYALSSGLFNIKKETLEKNKANLQFEINNFEQEKDKIQENIKNLNKTVINLEEQKDNAINNAEKAKKELEIAEKGKEALANENKEIRILLDEKEKLEELYNKRIRNPILNREKPIVELLSFDVSSEIRHVQISLFDNNLNKLDDSEFSIHYGNPNESYQYFSFNKSSGKYETNMLIDLMSVHNLSTHNVILTIYKKGLKSPWYAYIPYIKAEWQIILTNYPE